MYVTVDLWLIGGVDTQLLDDGLVFGCDSQCEIEQVSEDCEFFFVGEV